MAIYPGATKKLIDTKYLSGKSMAVYNRVNLHVQAGNGSLYGFFSAPNRASSHFWVSKKGSVEQYVDTKLRAEADLDGNDATISIETEGGTGSTADSDPWTDAQVDAIVDLVRWIMDTHKIPMSQASTAYTNSTSKGQSWHRLGIDGNFPALPDIRAGRKQRGDSSQMYYSSSAGKICPGGGKIKQIPGILSRVKGDTPPPPTPDPDPKPPSGDLVVDGDWGTATTKKAQKVLKTEVDGEVWHQWEPTKAKNPGLTSGWKWDKTADGSPLIKAMQKVLAKENGYKGEIDGLIGTDTIKAFQRRMGTEVDGELWLESPAIKQFQKRLNQGKW